MGRAFFVFLETLFCIIIIIRVVSPTHRTVQPYPVDRASNVTLHSLARVRRDEMPSLTTVPPDPISTRTTDFCTRATVPW